MPSPPPPALARLLYVGAVLSLLAVGILLRAWGVVPVPLAFWADEAWWTELLQSGQFAQYGFRPVGYMWLCRELLAFGSPELVLRLPALIAGCAALVCLYKSAEWSTRTRAAALFVLLVAAFHPKLAVFAKEFKPYSVEVFVFSALTLWTLGCLHRGWGKAGLAVAALASLPFCYPVVFLYPGLAIALAGDRLAVLRRISARQWRFAALIGIPAVALLHFLVYERMNAGANRLLWGAKYDVFPIDAGFFGGIAWYAEKTWSLVTLGGSLDGMPGPGLAVFGIGFFAGIALLVRARQWAVLALFAGPIVMALVANLLGYWPYGAFRANLFLVPGILLVTAQSMDWLAARRRIRWVAYSLMAGILAVVTVGGLQGFRTKLSPHWAAAPQLTDVIAVIRSRWLPDAGQWNDVILADWHSWRPLDYYLPREPALSRDLRLVRGPVADLAALESQLAAEIERAVGAGRPMRLWLVVTRLDAHAAIRQSEAVARYKVYDHEFVTGDRAYHPVLIELQVGTPADLLPASAQRYHPRPRAIRAT